MHTELVWGKLVEEFREHSAVSNLLLLAGCRGHAVVVA